MEAPKAVLLVLLAACLTLLPPASASPVYDWKWRRGRASYFGEGDW